MNREFAPDHKQIDEDENLEAHLTDYCIGNDVIHMAFFIIIHNMPHLFFNAQTIIYITLCFHFI